MNILKITTLAGVTCLAVFLGYKYVTADPPGYCQVQQRYISDEEFIRTSVALLDLKRKQDKLVWDTKPDLYAHYIRSNEILDQNRNRPGFTHVWRNDTRTVYRWLFGWQQVEITLNANSGDGLIRFYYDVCGKLKDSDIGLPSANTDPITTTTKY